MTKGTQTALGLSDYFRIRRINANEKYKVNGITITPFKSFHDAEEPVNFLISGQGINFVYITDTGKTPYNIKNLTHIMIEANYDPDLLIENVENGKVSSLNYKRLKQTHLSIDAVIEFLKKTDLSHTKRIYLIHLSDRNSNAKEFKEKVEKLTGIETYVLGGK